MHFLYVSLPNCSGVVQLSGAFSPIHLITVDALLTSNKVGCIAHGKMVRGGILNYGGYTLSVKENKNEF